MDKSLEFHRRHAEERSAARSEMLEELFVAGEWVGGTASGRTFEVTNPSNGQTIAVLPDGGREEMQLAMTPRRPPSRNGPRGPPRTGPRSCRTPPV